MRHFFLLSLLSLIGSAFAADCELVDVFQIAADEGYSGSSYYETSQIFPDMVPTGPGAGDDMPLITDGYVKTFSKITTTSDFRLHEAYAFGSEFGSAQAEDVYFELWSSPPGLETEQGSFIHAVQGGVKEYGVLSFVETHGLANYLLPAGTYWITFFIRQNRYGNTQTARVSKWEWQVTKEGCPHHSHYVYNPSNVNLDTCSHPSSKVRTTGLYSGLMSFAIKGCAV